MVSSLESMTLDDMKKDVKLAKRQRSQHKERVKLMKGSGPFTDDSLGRHYAGKHRIESRMVIGLLDKYIPELEERIITVSQEEEVNTTVRKQWKKMNKRTSRNRRENRLAKKRWTALQPVTF